MGDTSRKQRKHYPSEEFPLHFGIYNDRHQLLISGHLKHRNLTELVMDCFTKHATKVDREVLTTVYNSDLPRLDYGWGPHEPPMPSRHSSQDFWHLFLRRLQSDDFTEYQVRLSPALDTLLGQVIVDEVLRASKLKPRGLFGSWF